jgi:hypothetical protein
MTISSFHRIKLPGISRSTRTIAMSKDAADSARLSRAQQKQLSRDRDAIRLQSGKVGADELKRRNGFFSALPIKKY